MARAVSSSAAAAGPEAYDRYVGRYGPELARELLRVTGVVAGQRALDVGCGTGALTHALAEVLGPTKVAAVDPSEEFVAACRARMPEVEVRLGAGERLPWEDDSFDAVLAQLVMDKMDDARSGVREMQRVARPAGTVSACVWDFAEGMTLLRGIWDAAVDVDAQLARSLGADRRNPCSRPGELEQLWHDAGFERVEASVIEAGADYADFDDLWYPFANGVGAPGHFHDLLDPPGRERFKLRAAERLGSPSGRFRLTAKAWCVRGDVPAT